MLRSISLIVHNWCTQRIIPTNCFKWWASNWWMNEFIILIICKFLFLFFQGIALLGSLNSPISTIWGLWCVIQRSFWPKVQFFYIAVIPYELCAPVIICREGGGTPNRMRLKLGPFLDADWAWICWNGSAQFRLEHFYGLRLSWPLIDVLTP